MVSNNDVEMQFFKLCTILLKEVWKLLFTLFLVLNAGAPMVHNSFSLGYTLLKPKTSLAPLSRFRGSHVTTAHAHQCCTFQSYAKTVPSWMKLTSKIDKAWTTFLGIHDNGPRDHGLWCLTLTAYCILYHKIFKISGEFRKSYVIELWQ